jgi:hypothetical protein
MFEKVSTLPIFRPFPRFTHVQNIATWQNIHIIKYYVDMARCIPKISYMEKGAFLIN